MAEDVVEHSIAAPRAEPESLVAPVRPREHPSVHRWRFGLAYLALAVLAGTGIGIAVMVLDRPEKADPPAWSEWRPVGRTTSYASQIAEYVSPAYRSPSGQQLAAVVAGPPTAAGLPVEAVLIRHDPPISSGRTAYEIHTTENTVTYTMCGTSPLCSLDVEPTREVLALLRNQALELSLYTFKYVAGAEAVIVLLPPDIAGTPDDRNDDRRTALYFRNQDLAGELARPTLRTIPDTEMDQLSRPNIFDFRFDRLQNDAAIIVLTPLNARP